MMKEKYITDNGYGATHDQAKQGYTDETVQDKDDWQKEWDEKEAYRNTGFGRDTGQER